jgi:hypothetical protein
MIKRLDWAHRTHYNELSSPFMRGEGERPLRITLHSNSLTELTNEEATAVTLIRELGLLTQVQVYETEPCNRPHIVIGGFDPEADIIPVQVIREGKPPIYTGIMFPRQWPGIAARLVGQTDHNHKDAKEMLEVLLIARGHCSANGDILVTSSPLLLQHRDKGFLREANVRTPIEAIKIAGLFLRSRSTYVCSARPKVKESLDRGGFYWVLARSRLPNMWQYFGACVAAGKARKEDVAGLGGSILVRAVRALEARDYIGMRFYQPQNNEARDIITYHFDYLTLLLAGVVDAQARITNIAYQVFPKRRDVSFRRRDFVEALPGKGAVELHDFTTGQRFKDVTSLLYELRNTIHEAALRAISYHAVPESENTFIELPWGINSLIWDAAERCGSAERWGLTKSPRKDIFLEPYSYAMALVEESLGVIDAIAAATDVKRLFPDNQVLTLGQTPPADSVFKWADRVALLG